MTRWIRSSAGDQLGRLARRRAFRVGAVWVAGAAMFLVAISPRTVHAICRVIEHGTGAPVAFDPETSAFYVLAPDVVIGWECPPGLEPENPLPDAGPLGDAGSPLDAAVLFDGGLPFDLDASIESDAGDFDLDAGTLASEDGGIPVPPPIGPDTECRDGSRATAVRASVVSLVVQPHLLSGGGEAVLVMPVPAHPQVVLATPSIFSSVRAASSNVVHETIEVIEDESLGFQCTDPHYSASRSEAGVEEYATLLAAAPMGVFGCSPESSYYATDAGRHETTLYHPDGGGADSSVIVESIPTTDEYDVVLLSATDSDALSAWLDDHGFPHDADDDQAFANYIGEDHWFLALRVHPPEGAARRDLAPLVVSWLGDEVPITHRLQYDPDGGVLVTDAWVLAPSRLDAEDESAITQSADRLLLVPETLRGFGLQTGFLTHLRISRQQRDDVPDSRLVPVDNVIVSGRLERTTRVRIPRACCPLGIVAPASPARTYRYERTYPVNESPALQPEWLHTTYDSSSLECADEADYAWGGGWGSGSGSGSGGSRLRGCAVPARPSATRRRFDVLLSWLPVGLALVWLWGRSRRR